MTAPPFPPHDTILLRLPLRPGDDPNVWEARVLWTTRGALGAVAAGALWPVLAGLDYLDDPPSESRPPPTLTVTAISRDAGHLSLAYLDDLLAGRLDSGPVAPSPNFLLTDDDVVPGEYWERFDWGWVFDD